MAGNQVERRSVPRAKADFAIHLSDGDEKTEARIKDLSTRGLSCTFPEPIGEMTLVAISLELPGAPQAYDIQGAVVRCEKLRGRKPPTYEIGIYFTTIEPEGRRAIAGYVEQQLSGTGA
jgi:hypothetical protein